ncbi:MAG: hypothetical protein GX572_06105 [Clostridia bacterium]|nr:hypothetical protein [Clostridia bacterium]
MNIKPQKPKNSADLKKLLQQYNHVLTPQNRQFINELIQNLDAGGDKNALQDLARRMQQATNQGKK